MNRKMLYHLLLALLLLSNNVDAVEEAKKEQPKLEDLQVEPANFDHNSWDDFTTTLSFIGHGSYLQFKGTQNLVLWGVTALTTLYYIKNDKRISSKIATRNKTSGPLTLLSEIGILFNSPIIPLAFYTTSRIREDEKMLRFSQEYMATATLALVETSLISLIPLHERPDSNNVSFWEEKFRQNSSFPSGHVIGYTALGIKAFQFYGPLASILPFSLAIATGYERVITEKHYISDVVAGGLITLLSSEGVRMASKYPKNHPFYDWIFKRNLDVKYVIKDDIPGVLISFNY